MIKKLVIEALQDVIRHKKVTEGCILHFDRGRQYCSLDCQAFAEDTGFISSFPYEDRSRVRGIWIYLDIL